MDKIKEYFQGFDEVVVTNRGMVFYRILAAFLGGVVLGLLIAPPRYAKYGCNNGNTNQVGQEGQGCENCCCGEEDE